MPDQTARQPLTDQQLTAAIYDALTNFQMVNRLPNLQHAQMRQHLAEHLAGALAPQLVAEVRRLRAENARYRSAWQSARERAQAYGEGILQVVKDRESYQGWLKQAEARIAELETAMEQIRHLHKDSPMGPCPVCIDADAITKGRDGLMPYPCPTGRLAGAQDCDPPSHRAARPAGAASEETSPADTFAGTQPCGHDDYHDSHPWHDRPGIWCPGIGYDDEPAG